MSESRRVERWFDGGVMLRPRGGTANAVDLARALARLAGAPDVALGPGAERVAQDIGRAGHYVFVLVDGLGMELIEALPEGSFFRSRVATELRAVFPATTAAALTSLATGLWPNQHAVPAWWTFLPEQGITAMVLPFVERFGKRPLEELGVEATAVYTEPSLMPRYGAATHSFLPSAIADSTYSSYFRGGTDATGYGSLTEAVDLVLGRVRGAKPPTYTYLYIADVDATAHRHGPDSSETRATVTEVEGHLERLAGGLGDGGRLIASADHGLLRVGEERKIRLEKQDELLELLLAPPTGEPRVPFFHVHEGRADEFERRFRDRFGEAFALLTVAETERLELFGPGPLSMTARARIGDYVALSEGDVLLYEPPEEMRGFHGGLTPAEMRIPLIVA